MESSKLRETNAKSSKSNTKGDKCQTSLKQHLTELYIFDSNVAMLQWFSEQFILNIIKNVLKLYG